MRLLNASADTSSASPRLTLSMASTPEEVREVQRLRYKVFIEGMGLTALANAERLDKDEYDAYCDHLIVRDSTTLKVVGTYRVLSTQDRWFLFRARVRSEPARQFARPHR